MTFPSGTPTKVVNLSYRNPAEGGRVNGIVRLTPNVPTIVIDGSPVRWTGGGKYRFDSQGRMVSASGVGVELLDNSASGSNPSGWLWDVSITIDGKTHGGSFSLAGVSSGVDLSELLEINPDTPTYVPVPGIQGERGLQGIPGVPGAQGIPGIQGIQGTAGTNGTDGTDGTNGSDGADGAPGIQGIQGVPGVKGDQGDVGPAGPPGIFYRIADVTITDDDLSGLPDAPTYRVVRTSANTPLQCSIEASPGQGIETTAKFIYLGAHYLEWVLLDSEGNIAKFHTSGTSTPPSAGDPGMYPALTLSRHPMPPFFIVSADHIDVNGKVTIGLAHQGAINGANNRVYAHPDYPFKMFLKNIGAPTP